jgi:DNA segregation ATPase FtsK/SpoIIIE-like protein
MQLLAAHSGDDSWAQRLADYSQARAAMNKVREQTRTIENEIIALREAGRRASQRSIEAEHRKGTDWRENVQPLRNRISDIREAAAQRLETTTKLSKDERRALAEHEKAEEAEIADLRLAVAARLQERTHFDTEIGDLRSTARQCADEARRKIEKRVELERSAETAALRTQLARLEYEAELERLHLVRDALTVSAGLRQTNLRPTAWWFPLVSPDGRWFTALVSTTQARIEAL